MQRRIVGIIASLVLVAALFFIGRWLWPAHPKIDRTPLINANVGIGQVLAEELLKVVPGPGRIVLVTDFDHDQSGGRKDEAWDAFCAAIKQHNSILISPAEIVQHDPNEEQAVGCPSAAFKGILERQADANAIVFFIDLPEWSRASALVPQNPKVKLLAIDHMRINPRSHYSGYFQSGLLSALILPKQATLETPAVPPQSPREWFDKYYSLDTPENYGDLPD